MRFIYTLLFFFLFLPISYGDLYIYHFGAKWCMPCVKLANEISKDAEAKDLISQFEGILEMDLDKFPETAKLWGVKDIPVYLIIDMSEINGKLTSKVIARWQITDDYALKSLKNFLKKNLTKPSK